MKVLSLIVTVAMVVVVWLLPTATCGMTLTAGAVAEIVGQRGLACPIVEIQEGEGTCPVLLADLTCPAAACTSKSKGPSHHANPSPARPWLLRKLQKQLLPGQVIAAPSWRPKSTPRLSNPPGWKQQDGFRDLLMLYNKYGPHPSPLCSPILLAISNNLARVTTR